MNIWDTTKELQGRDELVEFAREAFKMSRMNNVVPPAPPPPSMISMSQQQYPDQRLTSIAFAVQGLLALGLADAVTDLIAEEP